MQARSTFPGLGALTALVGFLIAMVLLYLFLYLGELRLIGWWLPTAAQRTQGLFSRLAGLIFYIVPLFVMAGITVAGYQHRAGATGRKTMTVLLVFTVAGVVTFAAAAVCVVLGAG